jgi:DNA (cytosine-5)-methyltransferase 1
VRLLAAARPRWFLGENVPGLLAVNNGRDFWAVVSDLDDLGYGVAWRVLDAQWFGLAQRRKRLFLAGCLGDGAPWLPAQVLLEPESGGGHPAPGRPPQPEVAGTLGSRAGGARTTGLDGHRAYIVSTLQGGGRRGHRIDAEGAAGGHLVTVPVAVRGRDGGGCLEAGQAGDPAVRRLTPREWERLQGFPDDWTRWAADGRQQSDSARYGRLGNAVAVPVAAWITRRLAAADRETRPGRYRGGAV